MRRYVLRAVLFSIVFVLTQAASSAAQTPPTPYVPDPTRPDADLTHFPSGSDINTWRRTLETLREYESRKEEIGEEVAEMYEPGGSEHIEDPNDGPGEYEVHDWKEEPYNEQSSVDWIRDSWRVVEPTHLDDFAECFEPRLVLPFCPMCQPMSIRVDGNFSSCPAEDNSGYIWEYWWPEFEIEINDYGISAVNVVDPLTVGVPRPDLVHMALAEQLKTVFREEAGVALSGLTGIDMDDADIPDELREDPHIGNSDYNGTTPWNQGLSQDAHIYRSYLQYQSSRNRCDDGDGGCNDFDWQWFEVKVGPVKFCFPTPFWYNGYKKGNTECFFDTLQKREKRRERNVWGWSEHSQYQQYWRIPEMSSLISMSRYRAASPTQAVISDRDPFELNDSLSEAFVRGGTCAAYRARRWPSLYGDLRTAVGIIPSSPPGASSICYQGGGSLYPLTGTLSGSYNSLHSKAILARRAIELMTRQKPAYLKPRQELPKFADGLLGGDSIDKMQMTYPVKSKCYRMHQLRDGILSLNSRIRAREGKPDDHGSARFLYWNKRKACTCQYKGWMSPEDERSRPFPFRWGCYRFPYEHDGFDSAWMQPIINMFGDEEDGRGDFYEGEQSDIDPVPWPAAAALWAEPASLVYPFVTDPN